VEVAPADQPGAPLHLPQLGTIWRTDCRRRSYLVVLQFQILGPLVVAQGDRTLCLGGHRQRAVLARLLVDAGRIVSCDELIEDVWEGRPPRTASKTLHKYVSELRHALGSRAPVDPDRHVLRTAGRGYVVDVTTGGLDVQQFTERVASARSARAAGDAAGAAAELEAALDLWRGEVLADFPDSSFAVPLRTGLSELRLTAIEERVDAIVSLGRNGEAVAELVRLVEAHPLRERLWALLMSALAASGRTAEALRAFQRYRRLLGDELGLEPSAQLRELESRLVLGEPNATRAEYDDVVGPPTNLPVPITSFVGRKPLMADVGTVLSRHRLVTLTGPGGSGKTRLAVEVARQALGTFPGGVWLVDLAPLRDPATLVGAVADVFGVVSQPGVDRTDGLVGALACRAPTLIVLDNCEHLASAPARLSQRLLVRCPRLRVLATSRSPLAVAGEAVRPVPPLDPTTEAVELFRDRAGLFAHAVVDPAEPAVADLCRRLDGLPLAVELAATATVMFTPAEINQRLGERLLQFEWPDAAEPARHHSLRATMEWSLGLLSPGASLLFSRLGVFGGPFSLDAADAVCGGDGLATDDVLPMLTELARASLVARDATTNTHGPTHYRLLETIRASASERLETSGDLDALRARHASWCLTTAAQAMVNTIGSDELRWRRRLDLARHDLRAALDYARHHDPRLGVQLCLSLWPHWLVWGRFQEGLEQLRPFLDPTMAIGRRGRAWVAIAAADLLADTGESCQATGWARHALAVFTSIGDEHGLAYAERALANAEYNRGNLECAARLLRNARRRIEPIGDPVGRMHVTYLVGMVETAQGRLAQAERTFRCQLRWCEELGSSLSEARSRWILAGLAKDRGDYETAAALCEESLARLAELDDHAALARAQALRAEIARLAGDADRAAELYPEALAHLRELGDQRATATALIGMATIALADGDGRQAASLFRESYQIRRRLGDQRGLAEPARGRVRAARAQRAADAGGTRNSAPTRRAARDREAGGRGRSAAKSQ
jgi:predicted ATPase/DNA-binding SARP family transcriptional activator